MHKVSFMCLFVKLVVLFAQNLFSCTLVDISLECKIFVILQLYDYSS